MHLQSHPCISPLISLLILLLIFAINESNLCFILTSPFYDDNYNGDKDYDDDDHDDDDEGYDDCDADLLLPSFYQREANKER